MLKRIVQKLLPQSQPKEGNKVLRTFLDDLIREHATYHNDGYEMYAYKLNHDEKKQFLFHILDAWEYEDYTANPTREREAINEYLPRMQELIDERLPRVYHEDMQEMGMALCHHKDNGEFYYVKR